MLLRVINFIFPLVLYGVIEGVKIEPPQATIKLAGRMSKMQTQTQTNVVTFQKKSHDELPAGEYFVGDLMSFLHDALYKAGDSGTYVSQWGHGFYLTTCDSGVFAGSNRDTYVVDSGTIGLCALELGDCTKYRGGGKTYRFDQPVTMKMTDGILTLTSGRHSMTIDTTKDVYVGSDDEGYDSWS